MEKDKSKIVRGTWAAGFTVASVWFGTHVGAGFATGNQVMQYYVNYGWTAMLFPLLSMGLLAYVMYVIMKYARIRGFDNYKDTFRDLWAPYSWMELTFELFYIVIILAAVAGCISGAADLLNSFIPIGSLMCTIIVTAMLILLSIFGVKLIIAASTFLSAAILVVAGIMIVSGISTHTAEIGTGVAQGLNNTGTAIWRGVFVYCGFQCVSVPAMISAATTLNNKGVKKAAILGGIMNGGMLALSGVMLIGWYNEIVAAGAQSLPNLFICQSIGWSWLLGLYSILLFCAFVSTSVTLIYTLINRFEGKLFPKAIPQIKLRKTIVGIIVIGLCMLVSRMGLTNIIKYAYGYDGYLALAVIVLPVIIIGNIKNKKYLKEHPNALKVVDAELVDEMIPDAAEEREEEAILDEIKEEKVEK